MLDSSKVVVVGSFMMDFVIRAQRRPFPGETITGESFNLFPGGKGANQAVAAARLGAEVSMIGRLGADDFGATFLRIMQQEDINVSGVVIDESVGTGIGSPVVQSSGENSIIIVPRANSFLTSADIRKSARIIEKARVLLLQLEVSLEASKEAARIANEAGVRVVLNPAPYMVLPSSFSHLVDVLVPNEIECEEYAGVAPTDLDSATEAGRKIIKDLGMRAVVITAGSEGCYVVTSDQAIHLPGQHVSKIIDTTGAGDGFCGAFAFALASGKSIIEAARYANKAASIVVTRMGAIPSLPRASEVQ